MMKRRKKTLFGDRRGAVIVELALIAPILATLAIGVVDMSNAFSRKLALEQGAQRALEKIMQTTDDNTVEDTLKTEAVCQVNGMVNGVCNTSPITASDVTVTYRAEYTSSSGTVTSYSNSNPLLVDANAVPANTTSEAHFISIKITDKYTPMFPLHFASFNSDGTYHISATAGIRQS